MKQKLAAVLFCIFASACAHHRDVRPSADGVNYVVVRAPEREAAERSAISQAQHYCENQGRVATFLSEKSDYKGTMDEGTRDTIRKGSTAAMIIGGTTGIVGHGQDTRTGGSLLGAAGTVGSVMTSGNDYVAEMKFRCQ